MLPLVAGGFQIVSRLHVQPVFRYFTWVRQTYSLQEGFLETSAEMGTLAGILEEAGYRREDGHWQAPEFVSLDRQTASLK